MDSKICDDRESESDGGQKQEYYHNRHDTNKDQWPSIYLHTPSPLSGFLSTMFAVLDRSCMQWKVPRHQWLAALATTATIAATAALAARPAVRRARAHLLERNPTRRPWEVRLGGELTWGKLIGMGEAFGARARFGVCGHVVLSGGNNEMNESREAQSKFHALGRH